jgi:hypothetical protein
MPFKIIFSVLVFAIIYFTSSGIAFSQSQTILSENQAAPVPSQTDPDAVLFQKYMESIQNFSIPAKIQVLKRFIELHPENRYVAQVKDMITEYYRLVDPQALREMNRPADTARPPSPPDKSSLPPRVPSAETIEALPLFPSFSAFPSFKVAPPKDGKTYSSGYSEGFKKGYDKGKDEGSGFGTGVAVGIVGTIVGEIILVLLIVAGAS